jgi:hypothetical protein
MKVEQIRALGTEWRRMALMRPGTRDPIVDCAGAEAYIDLYSLAAARARSHDQQRRKLMSHPFGDPPVPEEVEKDAVLLLAEITKDWCLIGLDGKTLSIRCTSVNAQELYCDPKMGWIRNQVESFAGNF